MLVVPSANLAFAHFPKTAGISLARLLRDRFADAGYVDPANIHLDVRSSLRRLRLRRHPFLGWARRLRGRQERPSEIAVDRPPALRVLGVIREPLEMATSLFDFWARSPIPADQMTGPTAACKAGDFRLFLQLLCETPGALPTYEGFFDEGGPLWPRTILVDMADLRAGLASAFARLRVDIDLDRLGRLNASERGWPDRRRLAEEAGEWGDRFRARFARYSELVRRG